MRYKHMFLLSALLLLLLLPPFAFADVYTVENDRLSLSVNEETLWLSVTDKQTGHTLQSGAELPEGQKLTAWTGFLTSTLSLELSKGTTATINRVDMRSAEAVVQTTRRGDGVDCVVDFVNHGQRVHVQIRLEEDGLSVTVPKDGIEEYGETRVCGLYLLPCFAATYQKEKEGYLFVPEAAGAIIEMTDGRGIGNAPYVKRIYGDNIGAETSVTTELNRAAEKVTLPVYGAVRTKDGIGYLAVVSQGAESAEIMAYPGGVITEYNWVGARFILREQYILQTTRTQGLSRREENAYLRDMTVRFFLLSGEDASYSGMAQRYRSHLLSQGALSQGDTTYRTRLDILGAETEKVLLWDSPVVMTTLSQASDIVSAYREAGVSAPLVIYRGWHPGGMSKSYGSGSMAIEGALGDLEDMQTLKGTVNADNGLFLADEETVLANTDRMYNTRLDLVRALGQSIAQAPTDKPMYKAFHYLTPYKAGEILRAYSAKYATYTDGVSLPTLPNTLYSCLSAEGTGSRGDTLNAYKSVLEDCGDMLLALQTPLAPYLNVTDAYLDMPLGTTSYSFITAEVPFLPMVISGSIPYYADYGNFDANQTRQLLKLIEYGAFPTYLLTYQDVQRLTNTNACDVFCAKWDVLIQAVAERDRTLRQVYEATDGSRMLRHELLSADAVRVCYENGLMVYINYGKADFVYDGVTVPAMGYAPVKGDEAP